MVKSSPDWWAGYDAGVSGCDRCPSAFDDPARAAVWLAGFDTGLTAAQAMAWASERSASVASAESRY